MVEYPYDLTLCMDRDISMTSFKVATFFNPTPDFKAKLMRAGAVRPLLYLHAQVLFIFITLYHLASILSFVLLKKYIHMNRFLDNL